MTAERPITPASTVERFLAQVGVQSVFGQPVQHGDVVVIPVAEVSLAFGFGFGQGDAGHEAPSGSGGGGGGGGKARPRGYIKITPEGVAYEPIVDHQREALAGMFVGAWAIYWVTKTVRTLINAIARQRSR
ncbi:MAG: hypothetical protein Kow0047_27700 [Anaerolineae bacterium]